LDDKIGKIKPGRIRTGFGLIDERLRAYSENVLNQAVDLSVIFFRSEQTDARSYLLLFARNMG